MIRKILGWAFIAFLVFYVLSDPAGAANSAQALLGGLKSGATSLASFANHLGS